jgi:hypothetical protein
MCDSPIEKSKSIIHDQCALYEQSHQFGCPNFFLSWALWENLKMFYKTCMHIFHSPTKT